MNANEIRKLLLKLQVGWSRVEITDEVVEFYEWGLEDVPYEIALEAARRWVASGKPFFPAVSDLRAILAKTAMGDVVPEAAWSEIKREALRHPAGVKKIFDSATNRTVENPGPSFSHPLIAEAVAATGWEFLCKSEDETEAKRQFTWTLKALTERALTQATLAPMSVQEEPIDAPANVRAIRSGRSA